MTGSTDVDANTSGLTAAVIDTGVNRANGKVFGNGFDRLGRPHTQRFEGLHHGRAGVHGTASTRSLTRTGHGTRRRGDHRR